jgi:hypothetical protein
MENDYFLNYKNKIKQDYDENIICFNLRQDKFNQIFNSLKLVSLSVTKNCKKNIQLHPNR